LDFYIKLCEDNSKRLDEYRKESEDLRSEIDELQAQVSYLKRNICFKESCKERQDIEPLQQKGGRKNEAKSVKKVEKA